MLQIDGGITSTLASSTAATALARWGGQWHPGLTSGTWQNLGSMAVSMGANSLLIVPAGFNPSTGFGSYSSLGLTHTAGTTLIVPAGQGFGGQGLDR